MHHGNVQTRPDFDLRENGGHPGLMVRPPRTAGQREPDPWVENMMRESCEGYGE